MNKTTLLVYVSAFFLLLLAFPISIRVIKGTPTTTIAVDPSFKEVTLGNNFTLGLNVSDVIDLYLWVVTVEWDDSIIEFQNYEEGTFLKAGGDTAIMDAGVSPGKIERLVCTILRNVPGVDGEGSLVTVTFYAKALGTTPINITFSDLLNSSGEHIPHDTYDGVVQVSPPPEHTLTIHSSPTEVTFTVDGIPHTTPWSETYDEGTSVSLEMPETHTIGDARYYWDQWSDGVTSRSRTVTMNTNIALTAHFTGPYYELTVTSSPLTGIAFTINGTLETTPYTEWLPEGSYTLEMPETHDGYVWSHWLEDGDTSRTKAIYLHGTTWTGVYTPASPPPPPVVGGEMALINKSELTFSPSTPPPIFILSVIALAAVASLVYIKHIKNTEPNACKS